MTGVHGLSLSLGRRTGGTGGAPSPPTEFVNLEDDVSFLLLESGDKMGLE